MNELPPMPEKVVLRQCLELLRRLKILHWRNNTGGRTDERDGKKRYTKFGVAGLPDVLAVYGGRLIAIETKSARGKLSVKQKAVLDNLRAAGAVACVVRSPEELLAALRSERIVP